MAPTRREALKAGVASVAVAAAASRSMAQQPTLSSVRTVRTGVLEIGYEEHGPSTGTAIILLHGFPFDVRSFDGVVGPLADAGHRVLVPYLRGFGPTRFLDPAVPKTAEQAAIGQDVIDLADALGIERFALSGFDWGNRAACIVSILHPERVLGQVAIGGYSVQNTVTLGPPGGSARQTARFWYMWYFNTDSGAAGLEANRHDIIRYLWETWSPTWQYTDQAYARSAPSFDNPDFVDVVIHSYRHRLLNAPGEDRFLEVERRLAGRPTVDVPAIVLHGADNGLATPSANPAADRARFTTLVARRVLAGAGHDLPAHRPAAVSDALLELLG